MIQKSDLSAKIKYLKETSQQNLDIGNEEWHTLISCFSMKYGGKIIHHELIHVR